MYAKDDFDYMTCPVSHSVQALHASMDLDHWVLKYVQKIVLFKTKKDTGDLIYSPNAQQHTLQEHV